jgi:hypothetical protein
LLVTGENRKRVAVTRLFALAGRTSSAALFPVADRLRIQVNEYAATIPIRTKNIDRYWSRQGPGAPCIARGGSAACSCARTAAARWPSCYSRRLGRLLGCSAAAGGDRD